MTGLAYRSRDEERDDRRQQEKLLAALGAAPSQLRRDEAGWWTIVGRRGSIHTWGDGRSWVVRVTARSTRHWSMIKRQLAFMSVTQDGDEEGCLRLIRLPSPEEAALIREALLLRKRRTLSEASRAGLIAAGVNGRFRGRGGATAPCLVPDAAPTVPPEKIATNGPLDAVGLTEPEEVA